MSRYSLGKINLRAFNGVQKMIQRQASNASAHKTTCLYDFHRKQEARMEPFAGFLMPIVYKNQSIKSEHMHTRDLASAFDVSHMMQTVVRGKDRYKYIEGLTVADIEGLSFNKCVLSVFTNESGGIIDDCIIAKREEHLHIVSNAGNSNIVWKWLNNRLDNKLDVKLERLDGRGLIALQGPKAAEVLQKEVKIDLSNIEFMNTVDADIDGIGECIVTRCGYTGEDGFEISVDPKKAENLMNLLCEDRNVKAAGLGARDTLRLEAGLCLHGHDITEKTTPIEAALNWTVHKRRREDGTFLGSKVILDQIRQGSNVKRIGLVAKKSGPPAREGSVVTELDGKVKLGTVTSGTFAPKLGANIAMAYLPTSLSKDVGRSVNCVVRGGNYEYEIVKMPFVKSNYYFIKK